MLKEIHYNHCVCGQPYTVHVKGDFPWKDKFTETCPNCGRELVVKACAIEAIWEFDPNFYYHKQGRRDK